jgi:hypothetical protein
MAPVRSRNSLKGYLSALDTLNQRSRRKTGLSDYCDEQDDAGKANVLRILWMVERAYQRRRT